MASQASRIGHPTSTSGAAPRPQPFPTFTAAHVVPNLMNSTLRFNGYQLSREDLIEKEIEETFSLILTHSGQTFDRFQEIILQTSLDITHNKIFRSRCYLGQAQSCGEHATQVRLASWALETLQEIEDPLQQSPSITRRVLCNKAASVYAEIEEFAKQVFGQSHEIYFRANAGGERITQLMSSSALSTNPILP